MTPRKVLAAFATLFSLSAGCATTQTASDARMVASATRLVVEVEGSGNVAVGAGASECAEARCEVAWEHVADPVLVAQAAPGWRFDHWEAPSTPSEALRDPTQPRVYRAVFRRAGTEIAKR